MFLVSFVMVNVYGEQSGDAPWRDISCQLKQPRSVAIKMMNEYFFSALDEAQNPAIIRVKKGFASTWLMLPQAAEKLEVDIRRGYLFIAHGNTVSVRKFSKPEIEHKKFTLDSVDRIQDMSFSIVNRKLYVLTHEGKKLWAIDHVKDQVTTVFDQVELEKSDVEAWKNILVSNDGKRMYWVGKMKNESSYALGSYSLKEKKSEKKVSLAMSSAPLGLGIYKNFFTIVGAQKHEFEAYESRTWKKAHMEVPVSAFEPNISFSIDVSDLILLQGDDASACLRALPIKIKELD